MERVPLERKVLSENDRIAADLRARFAEHNILALNLISSPGSGKTSLLERTLESFDRHERVTVLTGDIQTENDAKRLARFGFPVKQITTAGTCHLDARMIERALLDWRLEDIDLLLIETSSARRATTWVRQQNWLFSVLRKERTSRSNTLRSFLSRNC
jgi:hydrogenase nickel incorporation protein HypB